MFGWSRIARAAYQLWPTKDLDPGTGSVRQHRTASKFEVWEWTEGNIPPNSVIIRSTSEDSISLSYPKGNFGENQLLDGSMSLSPLCPTLDIDLHVRTSSSFHPVFTRLQTSQVKITIFRVTIQKLNSDPAPKIKTGQWWGALKAPCSLETQMRPLLSLRIRVFHPNARFGMILHGSCFKTSSWRGFRLLDGGCRWGNEVLAEATIPHAFKNTPHTGNKGKGTGKRNTVHQIPYQTLPSNPFL